MLGLPCGVDTGLMKLFLLGVLGLSPPYPSFWLERVCSGGGAAGRPPSLFFPGEPAKRFAMKPDIAGECCCADFQLMRYSFVVKARRFCGAGAVGC